MSTAKFSEIHGLAAYLMFYFKFTSFNFRGVSLCAPDHRRRAVRSRAA